MRTTIVCLMFQQRCLEWFPRLRCMSLAEENAADPEQNELKQLRQLLLDTTHHVGQLTTQLHQVGDFAYGNETRVWGGGGCFGR